MPKTRKQLKAYARENLLGRYGLAIGAVLITLLVAGVLNIPFLNMVGQGIYFGVPFRIVVGALGIVCVILVVILVNDGTTRIHLMLARQQNPQFRDILYPFNNRPARYFGFGLLQIVITVACLTPGILFLVFSWMRFSASGETYPFSSEILLPFRIGILLLVIGAILCARILITWAMVPCALLDNSNLTVLQAIRRSRQLMRRGRWRYFILLLSFLGWAALSVLSFGIALLWIYSYYTQARICFYLDRCGIVDQ